MRMVAVVLTPAKVRQELQERRSKNELMCFWTRWKSTVGKPDVRILFLNGDTFLSQERGRIIIF